MLASLCRCSPSRSITTAVLPACLLFGSLVLGLLASPSAAKQPDELCTSETLSRSLTGDEQHVYDLTATEALLLRVEQQQLDVVLELETADGQRSVYDQPTYHWGEEVLVLDGQTPDLRLYIRAALPGTAPGNYTVHCQPLSAMTSDVRDAWAAVARAGRLRPLGTPETSHQTLAAYVEALALWRRAQLARRQAETLHAMALLRLETGDTETALASLQRAMALWSEEKESWRVAAVHHGLGYTRMQLGDLDAARGEYQQALRLWRQLGWARDEAITRNNLCLVDHLDGQLSAAADCYGALRSRFQSLGDRWYEALVLNNLGGVYDLQDLPDQALEHYHSALELRRQFGNPLEIAQTLNNIAVVHRRLGEFQQALLTYEQALEVMPATEKRSRGSVLYNIGNAYLSLGEPRRARAFLERALELRRQTGHRSGEILTLSLLAHCLHELGETGPALEAHAQAVEAAEGSGRNLLRALARRRFGETLLLEPGLDQGKAELARTHLQAALEIYRQLDLRRGESETLHHLGLALAKEGRHDEALATLGESITLQRQRDDRLLLLTSLGDLAALELQQPAADPESAARQRQRVSQHLTEALGLAETLRLEIVHPRLRATFLASRAQIFELAIDFHVGQHRSDPAAGHQRRALEISETSRSRSLLDLLAATDLETQGPVARADSTSGGSPQAQQLKQQRRQVQRQLRAVADRQEQKSEDLDLRRQTERRLQQLLAELDLVEARLDRIDPSATTPAATPVVDASEIQRLLDPETALLEYALGDRRSFVWRVTTASIDVFELPPRAILEQLARETWTGFRTVEAGGAGVAQAQRLSQAILAPVLDGLGADIQRLAVVPDGALQYLPFAALPSPEGPPSPEGLTSSEGGLLLERYEVVHLASASTLALQRQRGTSRSPSRATAIFADPVFSTADARCREVLAIDAIPGGETSAATATATARDAGSALPRLSASRKEAEVVAALQPPEQTHLALGFDANREAVLQHGLSGYRIVHFATHGRIDALHPELSGLILSRLDERCRPREGFLGLSDLYQLRLDAELVVLSGCGTALGEEIRGEGLLGMTQAFFHAGTPRVIASLWQVQDSATAELMERFYRALWQQNLRPAAALRNAQLSLRSDPRRRHPYFWAAFVLQGDWL